MLEGLTIYQLREGDCRWPLGAGDTRPPYIFCGQRTDIAVPHAIIAARRPTTNRGDMGIKIWLVVMAAWGTPLTIEQMPGMSSCKAVAKAIVEMSGGVDNVRCVAAYKDYQ
jgi:hypothetical protein